MRMTNCVVRYTDTSTDSGFKVGLPGRLLGYNPLNLVK